MTKSPSRYHTAKSVMLLSLSLLAGGCSADQPSEGDDKRAQLSAEKNQPAISQMTAAENQIPIEKMKTMKREEQILFAREDLAKRLGIEIEKVSLSGATPVMWRSGALGCPQPGKEYTQALVRGTLLMLRVGNTPYRYHSIPRGEPFHCPDNQAESPYTNSGDT